jgi:capsid protein
VIREGDCLALVDDQVTPDDSGKMLCWEADQIAPLSESEFAKAQYPGKSAGDVQDNGIIRNRFGRMLAYATTGKRGLPVISDIDDATIYSRDLARLACNPWRLNQGRGVPSLITPATNFIDLYEMLGSELQSAKRSAKQYAYVKRADAVTDYDAPAGRAQFLPENEGKNSGSLTNEGAGETSSTGTNAPNYERLEAFTGGLTDYLASGDDVLIPDIKHPNGQLAAFMDSVNGQAGAALGVAMANAHGLAATSTAMAR